MEQRGTMLSLLASLLFFAPGTAQSPAATTLPNLLDAMNGVDPILSNILNHPNPGTKNQIFNPLKTTSSSTNPDALHSFVKLKEIDKCTPEVSVDRVQSYYDFKQALSSILLCSSEAVEMPYERDAWPYLEINGSCSMGNVRKELSAEHFFQDNSGEIYIVTAVCTSHTVSINPFETPVFTPTFQRALQILENNSKYPSNKPVQEVFIEFEKFFGTHFSRLTHMGAKVVLLQGFPNKSLSAEEDTVRRRCVLESAYEVLTPDRRMKNETIVQHFSRESSERCGGELHDVSVVVIGPLPEGSLEDWASVVKQDPKPIYFELNKISNWFTNSWFQDPRGENQDELNSMPLFRYFENTSSDNCQQSLGGVCQQHPLKGCGSKTACTAQQNCVDVPETDQGYKCVEKGYGGIVIVGGDSASSKRCEAIGVSEPPAYPVFVGGNTLSLVNFTLYSCGGSTNGNVCRYHNVNDTSWTHFDLQWALSYHSSVTIADDIWFFTNSKLYIYHSNNVNLKYSSYDTPFSSDRFTSCAVSNGSSTFVIGWTSNGNELWLNKDASKPTEWEKLANMLETRISHSCLWFGSKLFVSGGRDKVGSPSIASVEVVDVDTGAVRFIGPLKEARRGHQMAVLHGKPAVLGGQSTTAMKSIETYDAKSNSWDTLNYTLQENKSYFGLVQYRV